MIFILDGGHGYNTPGKRTADGSMREWEFNNVVAKYAKEFLEAYENVKVLFSHDTTGQKDISLSERTKFARNSKGNCFVSIHANAHGNGGWTDANGIETFVMDKSGKSLELAQNVQIALVYKSGLRDRGVKSANFQVIRETYQHMPSILVECGFMTNQKEAGLLKTDAYRKLCASAIVEGIVKTFKLKPKEVKEESRVELFKPSTGTLKKEFRAYIQSAYDNKILSSVEWIQKIDNNTLTLSDAIALFATIENRK